MSDAQLNTLISKILLKDEIEKLKKRMNQLDQQLDSASKRKSGISSAMAKTICQRSENKHSTTNFQKEMVKTLQKQREDELNSRKGFKKEFPAKEQSGRNIRSQESSPTQEFDAKDEEIHCDVVKKKVYNQAFEAKVEAHGIQEKEPQEEDSNRINEENFSEGGIHAKGDDYLGLRERENLFANEEENILKERSNENEGKHQRISVAKSHQSLRKTKPSQNENTEFVQVQSQEKSKQSDFSHSSYKEKPFDFNSTKGEDEANESEYNMDSKYKADSNGRFKKEKESSIGSYYEDQDFAGVKNQKLGNLVKKVKGKIRECTLEPFVKCSSPTELFFPKKKKMHQCNKDLHKSQAFKAKSLRDAIEMKYYGRLKVCNECNFLLKNGYSSSLCQDHGAFKVKTEPGKKVPKRFEKYL